MVTQGSGLPEGVFDPLEQPKRRFGRKKQLQGARPWGPSFAVFYTIFLYVATQVIAGIGLVLALGLMGWDQSRIEQWVENAAAAQFFYVLLIESTTVAAVFWYVHKRGVALTQIGWNIPRLRHIGQAALAFVVYFVALIVVMTIATELSSQVDPNQKQELGFDSVVGTTDLILTGLSLIVLAPVAEEILFRGFLLKGLRSKLSWLPAVILTSVIFAVGHLQIGSGNPLLWSAAVDTFVLSLVLCYVRIRSDSLWPGIFIHATKNSIAFVALFLIAS